MTKTMETPGLADRFAQLGYLLKHTFVIVGKNPGIVRPWIRMAVYAAVMVTVFFLGIACIALDSGALATLLLIVAVGMFIYKYFFYNRQELHQSWLVSESIQQRPADADAAKARVAELKGSYRRLALLDMLFGWVASRQSNSENKGLVGGLINALLAGLVEVWDLVNHYMLPAIAIDGLSLSDGVQRMKSLKDEVPETLMGVFGIDLAGRAVGTIVGPLYALLVIVAILLGFALGDAVTAFHAGDIRTMFESNPPGWLPEGPLHFSWLPLLIAIGIGKLFSAVFERLVTSVKVIYFTIFYMRITHPDAIPAELRNELEAYLKMEKEEPSEALASE